MFIVILLYHRKPVVDIFAADFHHDLLQNKKPKTLRYGFFKFHQGHCFINFLLKLAAKHPYSYGYRWNANSKTGQTNLPE